MAGPSPRLYPSVPAHADSRSLRKLLDAVLSLQCELDMRALLLRIVRHAVDLVDAGDGALGVLDETRTRVVLRVTPDESRYVSSSGPPLNQWFVGLLIADAKPTRVNDNAMAGGLPRTFLGVPIWSRDTVFGHLYLTDKTTAEVFSDTDEKLITSLAAAAGVAVENAERYAQIVRRRHAAV